MRIYATRRECEIILSSLCDRMKDVPMNELPEYQKITQKIVEVINRQCKKDTTEYDGYSERR